MGEFGAATQLEKIDMLDYGGTCIAVNKFGKPGSEDAFGRTKAGAEE